MGTIYRPSRYHPTHTSMGSHGWSHTGMSAYGNFVCVVTVVHVRKKILTARIPIDQNKKRERVGNKLYIEGCMFQYLGNSYIVIEKPQPLHRGSIYGFNSYDWFRCLILFSRLEESRLKIIVTNTLEYILEYVVRLQIYGRTLSLESSFYHIFIQVQKK